MTGRAYLSREETIKQLRRLERAKGAPLIATEIVGTNVWIKWSALHHFGTFPDARKAAGLKRPRYRQKWTKKALLDELRKADRRRVRMTYNAMEEAGLGWLLISLLKYAGGLTVARRLAGIPAPTPRRGSPSGLDDADVVQTIQRMKDAGEPLAYSRVDPQFRRAAISRFKSWRGAVEAAGIDYASISLRQHSFTDDELLAIVRDLHRRYPRISLTELHRKQRHGNILRQRFGSLERAARIAGIEDWPIRKHGPLTVSRRTVLTELRRRTRAGLSCSYDSLREQAPHLITGAVRYYRTLRAALTAAGIGDGYAEQRERKRQEILAAIQARARSRRSLVRRDVAQSDQSLVRRAQHYFGSWAAAVATAKRADVRK